MTTQTAPVEIDSLTNHVPICAPEELRDLQDLWDRIARRAYELFEARGGGHGYDWRDWFQAESDLLRPVEFTVIESNDDVRVRAVVLGFEADELKLAIEPRRVIVHGKKRLIPELGNKVFYVEWAPDEIFKSIELPIAVIPEEAECTLRGGVLELVLPKR